MRRLRLPRVPAGLAGFDHGSIDLIRRILAQSLRPNWHSFAAGTVFLVVMSGATAAMAWIMKDVVNQIFVDKNAGMLWVISGAILAIFLVKGWATFMQSVILARVGNKIVAENQTRVYDHLLGLDMNYFLRSKSSDLILKISYGAQSARAVVELIVQSVGRDLLTLVALGSVMIIQAPFMSIVALVTAPPAIYGILYLSRRIRDLTKVEFTSMAEIIAVVQETTHGARILKAFSLEPHMSARMGEAIDGVVRRANKIASLQARTAPLMETLTGFAVTAVVLIAGWQSIHRETSPGEMMSFITALLLAYEPAKRLARVHVELTTSLVGARMMFDLLDEMPGPTEAWHLPALEVTDGRIDLDDVHFAYKSDLPVLGGVSFTAERGKLTALVGRTGGGKTTIFNLLQRFYDVRGGSISIDGSDIRSVSVGSLRHAISYVSQDTYLFKGTIRDNIRLGRLDASNAEVEQAARDAHVDEFADALSNGLDSAIGENGVQLSGGQRQRIAIARAMVKDAPIVLLDEATSALDSETERKVQDALARLMDGRTTIVIAHRFSTVMNADQILVLDNGKIVERGSHRDLIAQGGLYDRLRRLQFTDADDIAAPAATG